MAADDYIVAKRLLTAASANDKHRLGTVQLLVTSAANSTTIKVTMTNSGYLNLNGWSVTNNNTASVRISNSIVKNMYSHSGIVFYFMMTSGFPYDNMLSINGVSSYGNNGWNGFNYLLLRSTPTIIPAEYFDIKRYSSNKDKAISNASIYVTVITF